MVENLNGHTIAFVASNGVEQVELTAPWEAVKEAGATPVLVSDQKDSITAMQGDWEHGDSSPWTVTLVKPKSKILIPWFCQAGR